MNPRFKGGVLAFALVAVLAGAGVCRAGDIEYDLVPEDVGGITVTGTITTDGTIGDLLTADITGWDITLSLSGYPNEVLSSATISDDMSIQGTDLTATSSQISWDFSGGSCCKFIIEPAGPPTTQWNLYTNRFDVDFNGGEYANYQSTEEVIASTPEPSPAVLTVIGLGLLAASMRKRMIPSFPRAARNRRDISAA